ncbi:hypothetical protein HDV05_008133 [Chytridiales sp. JEL 0842]|nr:hypothetical protein HDV05_008133 [Chytridiales sp. JEL 0842]
MESKCESKITKIRLLLLLLSVAATSTTSSVSASVDRKGPRAEPVGPAVSHSSLSDSLKLPSILVQHHQPSPPTSQDSSKEAEENTVALHERWSQLSPAQKDKVTGLLMPRSHPPIDFAQHLQNVERRQATSSTGSIVGVKSTVPKRLLTIPQQIQQASNDLTFLIAAPGNCLFQKTDLQPSAPSHNLAALWLRALFHDAGTFDVNNPAASGGLDGSLLNELDWEDNKGLRESMATRFASQVKYDLSSADIITLGAIVTVAHCGGPQIPFRPGRPDIVPSNSTNIPLSLPADPFMDLPTLITGFARMGLTPLDALNLVTGSHTLGGAHKAISPKVTNDTFAPFDDTPGVFDTRVFALALQNNCLLPIDCLLVQDPDLKPVAESYIKDPQLFFSAYRDSMIKMINSLTQGTVGEVVNIQIPLHTNLIKEGTVKLTRTATGGAAAPGVNGVGVGIAAATPTGAATKTNGSTKRGLAESAWGVLLGGLAGVLML